MALYPRNKLVKRIHEQFFFSSFFHPSSLLQVYICRDSDYVVDTTKGILSDLCYPNFRQRSMEVYPLGPYLLCLATGIWWFCEFLRRDVLFLFVLQGLQKNICLPWDCLWYFFFVLYATGSSKPRKLIVSLVRLLEVEDTIFRNHLAAQESLICMMRRSPRRRL